MEFSWAAHGERFGFDVTERAFFKVEANIDGPLPAEQVSSETTQQGLVTHEQQMLAILIAGEAEEQVFHRALRREPGDLFEPILDSQRTGENFGRLAGAEQGTGQHTVEWYGKPQDSLRSFAHALGALRSEGPFAVMLHRSIVSRRGDPVAQQINIHRPGAALRASMLGGITPVIEEKRKDSLVDFIALVTNRRYGRRAGLFGF